MNIEFSIESIDYIKTVQSINCDRRTVLRAQHLSELIEPNSHNSERAKERPESSWRILE